MEDFDIQFNMSGSKNELTDNYVDLDFNTKKNYVNFDAEKDEEEKKERTFADTLNSFTKDFKQITGFKTNEQRQKQKEKEIAEKGTKVKILGMNPFIAITLALALVIGGSVAIVKIK